MTESEHLCRRPGWECRVCGLPWPCAEARARLSAEFRRFPTTLRIYMAAQMADAIDDLRHGGSPVPGDLYRRFLGWPRR